MRTTVSAKRRSGDLKNEYDMVVDRKSIKRNLMDLMDYGYEIEYSESVRMVRTRLQAGWRKSLLLRFLFGPGVHRQ